MQYPIMLKMANGTEKQFWLSDEKLQFGGETELSEASYTDLGGVRTGNNFLMVNGRATCDKLTVEQFGRLTDYGFVSTGTLKNVLAGYEENLGEFTAQYTGTIELQDFSPISIDLGGLRKEVRVFICLQPNSGLCNNYGLVQFWRNGENLGDFVEFGGMPTAKSNAQVAYIKYNIGDYPQYTTWSDSGGRGTMMIRNGMAQAHSSWKTLYYPQIDKIVLTNYKGKVNVGIFYR